MRYSVVFFVFFTLGTASVLAQFSPVLNEYEKDLQQRFAEIVPLMPDSIKIKHNNYIEKHMTDALSMAEAFFYPFDSLKNIGKITSRDQKLRLLTWNLLYSDGTHQYYGFVLYRPDNKAKHFLLRLTDRSATIENPEMLTLDTENWFGALYYEIIEKKWDGVTLYTLLGYDPNNMFISKKIIDNLYFREDSIPVFGAPVFKKNNAFLHRIIFEYSARVSMSLRYNQDLKMIVFDHLSPAKPSYTGSYQFYGPDFSFDAFKFTDDHWELVEDIDMRNR
ncbi:MAG: hypothetical protein JXR41_06225 [Bacteroidales bacterium]|nr:hypothetical protein [Bacteroidales bacterium]MBN2762667.1 hypothetical protein [Bacteroidales bacterium]